MQQIVLSGLISFILTLLVIPVIIVIAKAKKLYDLPDDTRKLHKEPIPSLGGLGMFIGFIFGLLLTLNFAIVPEFQFYIAAFLLIFFLGLKDDIMVLSPTKKFICQLLTAAILVFKADLVLDNMHGFLGLNNIPVIISYLLSIFSIVVIINAFNLIDGVDGLAGGLGLVSSLVFGMYFLINNNIAYAVLGFSFAGCLIAFLFYNFYPARIFMGDTGSLMIGLINSILVIKFIQTAPTYTVYPITSAPAIGFGILILPLMDTLRVFGLRLIHRRSPFSPDRNHVHHLLLNKGLSHRSVSLSCMAATLVIASLGFVFHQLGTNILIASQIVLFFAFIYIVTYKKRRYKLRVIKGEIKTDPADDVKLVSFYNNKAAVVDED